MDNKTQLSVSTEVLEKMAELAAQEIDGVKSIAKKAIDIKGAIIVGVIAGVVLIGTGVTLAVILTKKKAPAQEKDETKEETQK